MSDSRRRMSFSFQGRERGTGNSDAALRFISINPQVTSPYSNYLALSGASQIQVARQRLRLLLWPLWLG